MTPMLDDERYRGELIGRATGPLTAAGAVWLVAELSRTIVAAAQATAVPVSRLGMHTTVDFAVDTAAGRWLRRYGAAPSRASSSRSSIAVSGPGCCRGSPNCRSGVC